MSIEKGKAALKRAAQALRQDKKLLLLACGAAVLLLLAIPLKGAEKRNASPAQPEPDTAETAEGLEARLCALLGAIEGVGEVRVMVRLASSGETVFARNTDDAAEARDSQTSQKEKNSVVIVKNGQSESGLVVRETVPAVSGVAVVCAGGGDPVVRERVKETVGALFQIKSNHISVMPM